MGGRRREEALRDRVPEEVGDAEGEQRAPMGAVASGRRYCRSAPRRRAAARRWSLRRWCSVPPREGHPPASPLGGVPDAGAVRRLEKVIHLLARHRPSLFSI
jgi:hypothetical protein